ncbi:MAG: hypothetical protein ACD_3C00194G0001 [uncultured bacterium (gcode 4)]|uniref:Uncharacterized protein n=1 Tax=uncultured bacterium (gcode 4) TaxID=1234023 RepID=K2F8R6_9BACT|nr:MAG: hypothetical protein ACD_3C00194G0001 [uncultured bacterium (gcode 4)]
MKREQLKTWIIYSDIIYFGLLWPSVFLAEFSKNSIWFQWQQKNYRDIFILNYTILFPIIIIMSLIWSYLAYKYDKLRLSICFMVLPIINLFAIIYYFLNILYINEIIR